MGLLDKLLGRGKRTVGEAVDSPELKSEGRHQEAAGQSEERAERFEEMAQDEREQEARERSEADRASE